MSVIPFFVARRLTTLLAVLLALASFASAEWKENVLYSFQGAPDGQLPVGSIVFDSVGNLYGATTQGGANNCSPVAACGTVFQLSPPAKKGDPWTETLLHTFTGAQYGDGDLPYGGLVIDGSGNLYGVTAYGGSGDCVLLGIKGGCGTVYELSPPVQKGGAWTETILYSFPTAKRGYLPNGDLVFDSAGNLYGATEFGGGKGTTCDPFYQYCGEIFELSPPKKKGGAWTEKVLHSFAGGKDGANPNGGLALDKNGTVYGTTAYGGNESGDCQGGNGFTGCGTLFSLTPPIKKGAPWKEKKIHVFSDGADGGGPNGGLILDAKDSIYGTTGGGGSGTGKAGTVFQFAQTVHGWKESVLHSFADGKEPGYPQAGLTMDNSDTLYGTTINGPNFCGAVFRLKLSVGNGDRWIFATLYGFKGSPDGRHPAAPLVFDPAHHLYSATQGGGNSSGDGTVFKVTP